jgi:hypothetical protein
MKNRQHNGLKKVQKDKQRSTKHTKDQVTRTPLKTGVNSCAPEGKVWAIILLSIINIQKQCI